MKSNGTRVVRGKEVLVNALGYFPEFCDARILELTFLPCHESGPKLSILLHYIDMDLNIDLKSKFILNEVSNMNFIDMSIENIIDCLSIDDTSKSEVALKIEACVGFSGSCKCKALDIEVISLTPYN